MKIRDGTGLPKCCQTSKVNLRAIPLHQKGADKHGCQELGHRRWTEFPALSNGMYPAGKDWTVRLYPINPHLTQAPLLTGYLL